MTALGCAGASYNTNGTPGSFVNSGSASWPSGLSCYVQDNGVVTIANSGATARQKDATITNTLGAQFVASFQIQTSTALPSGYKWSLVGEERVSADADGIVRINGASARAKGSSKGFAKGNFVLTHLPNITVPKPEPDESSVGPKIAKLTVPLSGLAWLTNAGGYACVAKIWSGYLVASSGATGLGSGGNMFAASSGAAGGWSFYPSGAKSNAPGTGILSISVPPGRNAVSIDLYNASGVLVDKWGVAAEGGTSDLFIDDYAAGQYVLAFSARGTLVKKMTLNLDPTVSQTVSPAWQYGDLDGDNVVSQAEVDFVAAHVGHVVSSSPVDYDKGPTLESDYAVADADLNGDGVVNQADVNLAQANLGVHGD